MPFSSCDKHKHHAKKNNMYYAFVDLEKAFDKSPKGSGEMGFEEVECG